VSLWVESVAEVRRAVELARQSGQRIGLVPTMGALHAGHRRLIEECTTLADFVAVSVFVNPTQFGPGEDLERYPRPVDDDVAVCRAAGAAMVFAPSLATVYPHGLASTHVEVPGISAILEGASRPGHFRGVATIVLKLLEIVRPDVTCFGQKDYQQQLVVRRLLRDLHVPVELRVVPTVRELDGLALSSRNRYLSPAERQAALVLSRALERAEQAIAGGARDAGGVRQILADTIESERLAKLDYVEVAHTETLEPLGELGENGRAALLVAARVGTTRLIDNALVSWGFGGPEGT
jgi:pantoate--beta-alanine ligase